MAQKWFRKGAMLERMAGGMTSQMGQDMSSDGLPDLLSHEQMETLDGGLFEEAKFDAQGAENTGYSNYSYWRCTFQAFWKNKLAKVLLIALAVLILFTIIQPYLPMQKSPVTSYNDASGNHLRNNPPSKEFWFGTNSIGQDLWARVWKGTRTSLFLALIVSISDCVVGITIGILWGYVRRLDAFLTEVYNIIDNIPRTIILILISYIMNPGMLTMIISMCCVGWLGMARFIRNQIVMIRDRDYNLASRCLGTSTGRIMIKNLLPYLVSVIMLQTALAIPAVISDEVFLTYCGLGLPLAIPSLGNMVNSGRATMMSPTLRYQLIFPALIVSFITIAFYLVGNAFADASDPRNHV